MASSLASGAGRELYKVNRWRLLLGLLSLMLLAVACGGEGQEGQNPKNTQETDVSGQERPALASDSGSEGLAPLIWASSDEAGSESVIASQITESVMAAAYRPDGNPCPRPLPGAGGGGVGQSPQSIAPSQAVQLRLEEFEAPVSWATFNPDGRMVATLSDGQVAFWDAMSGSLEGVINVGDGLQSLVFSPDGQRFSAVVDQNTIVTWDLTSGRIVDKLLAVPYEDVRGRTYGIGAVSYSPDGTKMATSQGPVAWIWNVNSGLYIHKLEGQLIREAPAEIGWGHSNTISDLSFSPDGRVLITSGLDSTVRMWDVESGEHLRCYEEGVPLMFDSSTGLRSLEISSDGSAIMSNDHSTVYVWDMVTGELIQAIDQQDDRISSWGLYSASFSSEGDKILTTGNDATARVWDLDDGRLIALLRHPVYSAQYSPDGRRILTVLGEGDTNAEGPLFGAWIWDAEHDDLVLAAGAQNTANEGFELALAGDYNGSAERFVEAQALNPYPNFDLETQARERAALELYSTFETLVKDGQYERANELMAGASLFDPSLEMTAYDWNLLCRYGSLWGRANEALVHCDQAISMEAKADYYDSRGIARALSGDYEGAIEDFLVFAKAYDSRAGRADEVAQRVEWIEGLEEGRNPLDEATLEALRNE